MRLRPYALAYIKLGGNVEKDGWTLIDMHGRRAKIGETYFTYLCGLEVELRGGKPPRRPGMLGRIYVEDREGEKIEYFPNVCGLMWVLID